MGAQTLWSSASEIIAKILPSFLKEQLCHLVTSFHKTFFLGLGELTIFLTGTNYLLTAVGLA